MINFLCVCVNYADYLATTLKYNINIFDKIYIVTSESDNETKDLVSAYQKEHSSINLIQTDIFFNNGCSLNKGAGLNLGLQSIEDKDWILIGDADCIYPSHLQSLLPDLDKNCIYGMKRVVVHSQTSLNDLMDKKYEPQPRLEKAMHYTPGYCQLFNFQSEHLQNKQLTYPEYPTAQRVDRLFAKYNFPYQCRKVMYDQFVIHLGPTTINWAGRKSDKWK
jgi:hypothetical protein